MSATFHAAFTIPAAASLLPPALDVIEARAMVLAIGLQESDFDARIQKPRFGGLLPGPARSFWQFERKGGLVGLVSLESRARPMLVNACRVLRYTCERDALFEALQHNDVLGAVLARLLLWTVPKRLPARMEIDFAWEQYLEAWRPGEPRRERWLRSYVRAWTIVWESLERPAVKGLLP